MNIFKLILGIGIISFFLVMPRVSAAVTLKDKGWLTDKDENSDGRGDGGILNRTCKGSLNTRVRRISLNPGAKTFFLNYFTCTDPRHLKKGRQCHSSWQGASLGLYPGGWYSQGFMDVMVNGLSLNNYLPEISSEQSQKEAVARYCWETPEAKIKLEFKVRENLDYLFLKVNIIPKKKIFSIKTKFICFPGSMAPGKQERDRRIATAAREVKNGSKITLNKDEPWILYYDQIWDRAKKPGCSPCALFYPVIEAQKVELDIRNYEVLTFFTYPVERQEFNYVIFTDIPKSNQEALAFMKARTSKEKQSENYLADKVNEWNGQLKALRKKLEADRNSLDAMSEKIEKIKKRGSFMPGEAESIDNELQEKSLRYFID